MLRYCSVQPEIARLTSADHAHLSLTVLYSLLYLFYSLLYSTHNPSEKKEKKKKKNENRPVTPNLHQLTGPHLLFLPLPDTICLIVRSRLFQTFQTFDSPDSDRLQLNSLMS